MRAGAKFKDADLIGIPLRVTIGKKSLSEGNAEIKLRHKPESEKVKVEDVPACVIKLVDELKKTS